MQCCALRFSAQEQVQRRERRESGCTNAEASKTGDIYGFAMVSLTPKSAESGTSINSSSPAVGEINGHELWEGLNEMIGEAGERFSIGIKLWPNRVFAVVDRVVATKQNAPIFGDPVVVK